MIVLLFLFYVPGLKSIDHYPSTAFSGESKFHVWKCLSSIAIDEMENNSQFAYTVLCFSMLVPF